VAAPSHATRRSSHLAGCAGFWLWAVVGATAVLASVSFVGWFFLVPVAVVAVIVVPRRSEWKSGPTMLGLIAGAGLPLLLVAALNWNGWQNRTAGDNTPNPYEWGAVGVLLVVAGIVAYAIRTRTRR
jgi:hypothetical protein